MSTRGRRRRETGWVLGVGASLVLARAAKRIATVLVDLGFAPLVP